MSPHVTLAPIPVPVLRLLAGGDLAAAGRAMGMAVPPTALDLQWVWNHFANRREAEPVHAFWYTQYFAVEDGRIVGDVRMHEPPTSDGSVKIGYHVVPIDRRRGVAVAAARALIDVATAHEEVRVVVAQVHPTNHGSLAVCRRLGFVDVREEKHTITGQMMRRLELRLR